MTEKRKKLYLDTSVISANFDNRNPERKSLTQDFFSKTEQFELYYSYLTYIEIRQTNDENLKESMLKLLQPYIFLNSTLKINKLAEEYVKQGAIPKNYNEDAIHIAIATLNKMDYILSWNFKHLVKEKTRQIVNYLNSKHKYKQIMIITPAELL